MKKLASALKMLCLVLLAGVLLAGCGLTTVDGGNIVHQATITSWYGDNNQYLDTSVNINFDEIKVSDIKKITFTLKEGDEVLGNAVSEGDNLVTLLKDCAQYWGATADTYTEVTGDRTISCAFSTRTEENDNGYWVRSKCTATNAKVPDGLEVRVVVGDTEYVTEK